MIKKIPLPIVGVMLGFAALGNLIQSYSETVRLVFGAISALIGVLFLVKVIMYPKAFKEDMQNPIMASVSGTFSMALMILATYLKPLIGNSAVYVWYFAIALHMALIIYFTVKFIFKLQMPKVFASYFIVYVGIAVASISAPAFGKQFIGQICFWFAFVMLFVTLALVTYRYIKYKDIPQPAQPLFCIYTAPVSLCLAGYLQCIENKSSVMVYSLLALSTLIFFIVLIKLPKFLKFKFYPSYASFTFPFVITAIALKQSFKYLTTINAVSADNYFFKFLIPIETAIATVLVIYTFIRFLMAITSTSKQKQ